MPADSRMEPLLAKAHDLSRTATLLTGTRVPPELRALLRSMNAYYTNRIEGQHTRPHETDQALRQDFSHNAALAAKQRLAWVHPFVDGNGRVMRLHTHTWLTSMGYTGGLWSPLRGFASST
ncbi:Fic family protein [Rhodoferax aquaticus]|uniref:Fic family protein n=1 Tax=Rhodoferax aquaticus TaxID=2527691 RepID=UPI001F43FE0A|nr:Fic family protein [Rhodoferax aquaticus]